MLKSIFGGGGGAGPAGPAGPGDPISGYLVQTPDATVVGERVVTDTPQIAWDFSTAGQAKATIAPAAPIGAVTPGTGAFTTLSASTGKMAVTSFATNTAVWVDMATTGPSGIGSGGAGVEAWIAYASANANWFTNSLAGDIVYRNTTGRLLWGNTGGGFGMCLVGNRLGIGLVPTATLHLKAGVATASGAPLKFTSGPLLTTTEPGAEEYLNNDRYYTGADSTRRRYAMNAEVIRLRGFTVAGLPAGVQGDKAFVTDALGPTYLVTVVGGGAVVTEVFYNGTNWVCT